MWAFIGIAFVIGGLILLWTRELDRVAWATPETLARIERHDELSSAYISYIMEYGLEPSARELWDYTEGS